MGHKGETHHPGPELGNYTIGTASFTGKQQLDVKS